MTAESYGPATGKKKCDHEWNDGVVINIEHAVAVCEFCGRIAFERGYAPKKPMYVTRDNIVK